MENNISKKQPKDCCGCGVCLTVCPTKAIYMVLGEDGAEYPIVNKEKCIECGLCKKRCPTSNEIHGEIPKAIYIAQLKDEIKLKDSASGGAFMALAQAIIADAGVVYGATIYQEKKRIKC